MVAASAYRSGEKLTNEQDKREHDYRKRAHDIEFKRVLVPTDGALSELKRSTLWNAAEAAEKRKDARTGREFVLALPHELNQEQRAQLAEDFARELVKRYKVAADVCIHKPAKQGDERNHHAHILITTRSVSVSKDGSPTLVLGDKTALEWSDRKRQEKGLSKGADEMKELREKWAELANKALERAGKTERIDPRSNEAQGIERIPEEHLGHKMTALERKGVETTVGNRNRKTQKKNANITELKRIDKQAIDEVKRIEANYNNINAAIKQRPKEPPKPPAQPTPKPSHLKFAVIWALSFVSKNANEALERLKAQLEEAKKEKQRESQLEQTAEQRTAKVMQDLATKKQAQKAELKATDEKRQARHERGRSRRQSIENAKRQKASYQAELEKQHKQQEAQRQQEEAERQKREAAESYCKKFKNQRLQGVNVPRHQIYTGKGGEMIFRGIQHVGSQPLLLCQKENIDIVLVVPIDQQTEHRLKQTQIGEKITLNSDYSVAIKSEKTKNRGRSR